MESVIATVGMSEAKAHFSRLAENANRTGIPVTVFRHNRPWVEIRPLASHGDLAGLPKETLEAIEEAEALAASPDAPSYRTADELFRALGL